MSIERYKKNAPKGYGGDPARGAPLGRRDVNPLGEPQGALVLCRVVRNSGGYDVCGTYWGHSDAEDLFFAYGKDEGGEDIERFLWAYNAQFAKAAVRELYPGTPLHILEGRAIETCEKSEGDEENSWEDSEWEDRGWALVDALAADVEPEGLPTTLGNAFYDMCLRAGDHGAGAHDLAEMLRNVARRLDSAEEDDTQDRPDEGERAAGERGMFFVTPCRQHNVGQVDLTSGKQTCPSCVKDAERDAAQPSPGPSAAEQWFALWTIYKDKNIILTARAEAAEQRAEAAEQRGREAERARIADAFAALVEGETPKATALALVMSRWVAAGCGPDGVH